MVLDGCSLGLMAVVALTVTAILALTRPLRDLRMAAPVESVGGEDEAGSRAGHKTAFRLNPQPPRPGLRLVDVGEFALLGTRAISSRINRSSCVNHCSKRSRASGSAPARRVSTTWRRRARSPRSRSWPRTPARRSAIGACATRAGLDDRSTPDPGSPPACAHGPPPDPTGPAAHEVRRGLHRDHACRQVGELAPPVSTVAAELGVCWWRMMNAVVEHGPRWSTTPTASVRWPSSASTRPRSWSPTATTTACTSPAWSIEAKVVIDMREGNRAADLGRWTAKADPAWLDGVEVVATDLAESFRAGLSPDLDHARRVADPFHVVLAGNRCLDKVRRRVQNETLGHRGRKADHCIGSASCCSAARAPGPARPSAHAVGLGWVISRRRGASAWLAKES